MSEGASSAVVNESGERLKSRGGIKEDISVECALMHDGERSGFDSLSCGLRYGWSGGV